MLYKVSLNLSQYNTLESEWYALVEADNIRTARNIATEHFINVEKATELELVQAGREGWPFVGGAAPPVDDGHQDLPMLVCGRDLTAAELQDIAAGATGISEPYPGDGRFNSGHELPTPHAQTADTGEANPTFTPSTGSAPAWLPALSRNEGTHERLVETNGICRGEVEKFTPDAGD